MFNHKFSQNLAMKFNQSFVIMLDLTIRFSQSLDMKFINQD
jgi:hypothetical protein